ncbi:MAG TPA: SGNH/GDSL hydrolase family protein, partial [Cellvibrio sp.]|nr:SGNH/GDSL hydrolase family protein [Cellvibrio sp.]
MRKMKIYLFLLLTIVTNLACAQNATSTPTKILVMGDSLSAGYGIDIQQGWVSLLEQELAKNHSITMINASVSGETSSGGN